jgi:hypothetical protein
MRFTLNSCDRRPDDSGPACDVDRSDVVGVVRETARLTNKIGLSSTVGFVLTPALGASARCVSSVDTHHGNSSETCLVRQERSKLKERPSRVRRSLTLPHGYPLADMCQIFQRYPSRGVPSLRDDAFRDDVVRVGTKAGLLARETLEVSFRRLGAGRLKFGSKRLVPLSNSLDCGSRVRSSVRIEGDVSDPQIYPEPILGFDGRAVRDVDRHEEVELSRTVHEVSLSSDSLEASPVVVADCAGYNDAAVESQQAHAIESVLEGVEPLIVDDGSVFSERRTPGLVPLVNLADLGNCSHGVLRGKSKQISQIAVVELLQTDLVGRPKLEGSLRQPRAGLVDLLHRGQETRLLVEIDEQLDSGNELHYYRTTMSMLEMQPLRRRRFLPVLKDGASASRER